MLAEQLKAALQKLDVSNDNHWTEDGLPRIETLRLLAANPKLTREDVTKEFPDFNRKTPVDVQPAPPTAPPEPVPQVLAPEPVPEPAPAPASEQEEGDLAYEQDKLARMVDWLNQGKREIAAQQAKVDALILKQKEHDRKNNPHRNMNIIRSYLNSQQQVREASGDVHKRFAESGVKLADILPTKSALDAALASRAKKR